MIASPVGCSYNSQQMKHFADCRLYAFVDTEYLNRRAAEDVAKQICDGGADVIQLRAKKSSMSEILHLAELILPIAQKSSVGLVINDHLSVAQAVGADACHLGQEDFFDAGYNTVAELKGGDSRIKIGLSSHAPEQAERAVAAGADYIAVGPVYATATKPDAKPVTLDAVRWAAQNVSIPWFAIGGINLENLDDVLAAGAWRICVVSAILKAKNVQKACAEFRRRVP
jgi:thiamine-phosphate pyrophosphorylase